MSKYNWKNIKGVGLGIVAFEATEHLANIISEVRDSVDYVTIGLQRLSYHGDPIDPTDLAEIFRLRDEDHLVDNILEINLDTSKEARVQETDKRNLLIQDIEDHGCSHALIIDSDEYYTNKSFLKALIEIDKNDYEMTYCQYVNYYHDYKHFLVYPFSDGMYVPFVTKTKYRFHFESTDFPLPSDPTRRYVRPYDSYDNVNVNLNVGIIEGFDVDKDWQQLITGLSNKRPLLTQDEISNAVVLYIKNHIMEQNHLKDYAFKQETLDLIYKKVINTARKHFTVEYHTFPWETVKMHHLSCVRADIRKKFNSWSSKTCFNDYNDLIDKAVDTYKNFDPESDEMQNVSLLFGTPDHQVHVKAFPKQYIFPKYDIHDRYKPIKNYKKIAIMNMSTTVSKVNLFKELDKACKETWAKDVIDGRYPNIDYWTVIDSGKTYINKAAKTIFVHVDDNESNLQQMLKRWLIAYNVLCENGYKYDWILRANTSTWCNIPIINEFLANQFDDSETFTFRFFAAFWSTFHIYMSGAAMIWSTRNIPILKKIVDNTPNETLNLALDDVMMSALWRQRSEKLKLTDHNKLMHSFEGIHLQTTENNIDFDNLDFSCPMFQIKTYQNDEGAYPKDIDESYRLIHDVAKMRKVQEAWDKKKNDLDIEEIARNLRESGMDKTVNVIKFSKQEWTGNDIPDEVRAVQTFDTTMPLNDELIDWLENRASECGYVHAQRVKKNK